MCDSGYEYAGVFTVGGGTNSYIIHSPYNTECEFLVYSIAAIGTNASGVIAISAANPSLAGLAQLASTPVLGNVTGGADSNSFEGYYFPVSLTQSYSPPEVWAPLGRGLAVNIGIATAAGAAYVSVAFRRLTDQKIPDKPVIKPQTHSLGRRPRVNVTTAQGFEEQYAKPGTMYQHHDLPQQDGTGMRRGGAPLLPTTVSHRGVSKGEKDGR